jgi:ribonucleoside-diphosphate reductase beta chain
MRYVTKRSGEKELFELEKLQNAILHAMESVGRVDNEAAEKVARSSEQSLFKYEYQKLVSVDEIGDIVENRLMDSGFNDVAKEYILYRSKNKPNIFKKRVALKPYEYPELVEYVDAIRHSYWVHTEFNFTSDVQDFKVHLDEKEQSAVQRAMLAISQIEIAVKNFWGDIYKKMPKPEIGK